MLALKIALGKVDPEDIALLKARRNVKRLCKLLTYKKDVTSIWKVPSPNGGMDNQSFLALPEDYKTWLRGCMVRSNSAKALGDLGDQRAVPFLVRALGEARSELVQTSTARSLKKLDWQPGSDEVGGNYWCALGDWKKCKEIGGPAVDAMLVRLANNEVVRSQIRRTLAEIGEEAVGPLTESVEHWKQQYFSWIETARKNGLNFQYKSAYLISDCIKGTMDVLTACIRALGSIGDPRARNCLTALREVLDPAVTDDSITAMAEAFFRFKELRSSTQQALDGLGP